MSNSKTRPTNRGKTRRQDLTVRLSAHGYLRRFALFSGLGLSLLGALPHRAAAAPLGSAAWIAQLNAARATGQTAAGAPFTLPGVGSVSTAQQAQQQAYNSIHNMNAALAAIQAAQMAQQKAAGLPAAAQLAFDGGSLPTVPNGLVTGGLVPVSDPSSNSATCTNNCWVGADAPKSGPSVNGQTTVVVDQTAQKAILTWSSFNIGSNTTLDFNQGASNWVALNRVLDPSNNPAQILGSIKAPGDVYIIDQNGIIFGAGSRVNTHSLVASTLALYSSDIPTSNAYFLNSNFGLDSPPVINGHSAILVDNGPCQSSAAACNTIVIQQGASIDTGEAGFSLIAAPYVANAGTIAATDGQAILVGGDGVVSTSGPSGQLNVEAGDFNTFDKNLNYAVVNTGIVQAQRGNVTLSSANIYQDGVVDVTTSVSQAGSITINAAYDSNSTQLGGTLTFGGSSVTAILPDDSAVTAALQLPADTETTTSSTAATAAFVPGSGTFTGSAVDFENGSLVEAPGAVLNIAAVVSQSNAYVNGQISPWLLQDAGLDLTKPGNQIPAVATGRVYVDTGATIDVSGLANVELPVADSLVTIGPLTENDLADSPLLRDGFLFTQTVTVDSTISGVDANGQAWVGSPIIDAGAYINDVPRGIDQLLVNGGSLNMAGSEVITAAGSHINLNGGYVNYQAGVVGGTTNLLGADGKIYNISNANPNVEYVGFAGQTNEVQSRWNTTDSYTNPLLADSGAHYDPGFIQGGNAGALNIFVGGNGVNTTSGIPAGNSTSSSGTAILDGDITAQTVAGRNQVASGSQPLGGSFSIGGSSTLQNLSYSSFGVGNEPYGPSYVITNQDVDLSTTSNNGNFNADTSLLATTACTDSAACSGGNAADTGDLFAWTPINGQALAKAGFSNISITADHGQIVVESTAGLAVTPGGAFSSGGRTISDASINLNAGEVQVLGTLSAPSGSINVIATGLSASPTFTSSSLIGDIYVGPNAQLDAAGEWVNDTGRSADQIGGSGYINGGNITLATLAPGDGAAGSILLQSGSTLNVSSGGYVQPNGQLLMKNGIPEGEGGNLTLATYDGNSIVGNMGGQAYVGLATPASQPVTGTIGELVGGDTVDGVVVGGKLVDGIDAELLGYGFADGGTLTLRTLGVQIGNSNQSPYTNTPAWDLYLPAAFFSGQGAAKGFGNYVINAEYDATVVPGTQIALTQANYIPNFAAGSNILLAPTGTSLFQSGYTTIGTLDPFVRPATDLTITAGEYHNWIGPGLPQGPDYSAAGVTGSVSLGQGASINADTGASVTLGALGAVNVDGSISAPGGKIVLNGQTAPAFMQVGNQTGPSTPAADIVLGPDADLNVAGAVLVDPYATAVPINGVMTVPVTGTVLDGGSVSLYGNTIAAAPGSAIDVSGYGVNGSGISFDVAQSSSVYAPEQQWSNAGSITLAASNGLYFEGTLLGQPGSGVQNGAAASGQGGSLSLTALGTSAENLILQNGGAAALLPQNWYQNWTPGQAVSIAGTAANTLYFSTATLDHSGISSLDIGSNATPGGLPGSYVAPGQLTVGFAGNVDLALNQSFSADATGFVALAQGAMAISAAASSAAPTTAVSINAPYVSLSGDYDLGAGKYISPAAQPGNASLDVNARFIDLGGVFALDNFLKTSFNSTGPIRFLNNETYDFVGSSTTAQAGELYSAGNLTFSASELYPASGNSFIVEAGSQANPAMITIAQAGTVPTLPPLSAGGSLMLDAQTINQGGTIWAPSGNIILGSGTGGSYSPGGSGSLTLVATQNVALEKDSVTSVSLDNAVIPYGTTVDGQEWQYNDGPTASTANGLSAALPDLTAPPSKLIEINGASVSLDNNSKVDLSGGGELQAVEWVPGIGGTHNVLAYQNISYASNPNGSLVPLYGDGRGVYALVPSYEVPVAAYDPVFNQGQAPIAVGESVYLSGAPGLPAGKYTIMPAMYATLPGAYRVVQNTSAVNIPSSLNAVLPDGTQLVSGYFFNALSSTNGSLTRESTTTQFEIQSAATWGLYSQYNLTNANSFFAKLAAANGSVTPMLPQDAGQLILGASSSLSLPGTSGALLTQPSAGGGAAAEIDIAAQNIDIVGSAGAPPAPGVLQLTTTELNALDAGSLLIGGTRTQTSSGLDITALAGSVELNNAAPTALTGPEIILVTNGSGSGIKVDSGSVIQTTQPAAGATPPAGKPITIVAGSNGNADGALLMVSDSQPASLTRQGTLDNSGQLLLDIASGAQVGGSYTNSLLLDSSGVTTLDPSAVVNAKNITADAGNIVFVNGSTTPAGANGLIIGSGTLAQFAGAQQIDLRSYNGIDFESSGSSNSCNGTPNCFVIEVDVDKGNLTLSAAQFTDGAYGEAAPVQIKVPKGTLALTNDLSPAAVGTASTANPGILPPLYLSAQEIDFGTAGNATSTNVGFAGFGSFSATATGATAGIVLQGGGTAAGGSSAASSATSSATSSVFNFGDMTTVSLTAPVITAGTNSAVTLETTGSSSQIILGSNGGAALAAAGTGLGGAMSFQASTISDSAVLAAAGGNITLHATAADPSGGSALNLGSGAVVNVAGVGKQFFDTTQYANGGNIVLTADAGSIDVNSGARLDFSAAAGGGNAGSLTLSAPGGTVALGQNAIVSGGAAAGQGGSFSLSSANPVNLDALACVLDNSCAGNTGSHSGPYGTISVATGSGDLTLSSGLSYDNTLTAQAVSLTANGGAVTVAGTIDASGQGIDVASAGDIPKLPLQSQQAGGTIDLYGTGGVTVSGTLRATSSPICVGSGACTGASSNFVEYAPLQLGGTVNIGTSGTYNGTVNSTYGYENIVSSGAIDLTSSAVINVSGGSSSTLASDDLTGGTVNLRAPLLANGDVNVSIDPAATITGSRATTLEAYAIWKTTDSSTGAQHFDGIIDPAGWYVDASQETTPGTLQMEGGTYTEQDGNPVAAGSNPNANDPNLNSADGIYFTPTNPNPDHTGFYQTTLVNFVRNPGFTGPNLAKLGSENIANFAVAPGIELDNPVPTATNGAPNNGNIYVATNWNLGACSTCSGPGLQYLYRYNYQGQSVAPILTLRAGNDLNIDASISDGFTQPSAGPDLSYSSNAYNNDNALYGSVSPTVGNLDNSDLTKITITVNGAPVQIAGVNPSAAFFYDTPAKGQSVDYYTVDYNSFVNDYRTWIGSILPRLKYTVNPNQQATPANDGLPSLSSYPNNYAGYLAAYATWLNSTYKASSGLTPPPPAAPGSASTAQYTQYLSAWQSYANKVLTLDLTRGNPVYYVFAPSTPVAGSSLQSTVANGNSPANVATLTNLAPVANATLAGGNSSSYRLVAGADLGSANPLALQPADNFTGGNGSVSIAGGTLVANEGYNCTSASCVASSYVSNAFPNVVRTGNGSIAIAAADDFQLSTSAAPGVVYTAGVPMSASVTGSASNPEGGGNVSILAQNDIIGDENVLTGSGIVTGTTSANNISYLLWAPWMETDNNQIGNTSLYQSTAINFREFDQGIMSVGGNVSVSAGGNIQDLQVSLPTTWYLSSGSTGGSVVNTVGGGNLSVSAGQKIYSGDYFVARGSGSITAGGQIEADLVSSGSNALPGTIFALQDSVLQVNARQGVQIGAVYDPSYLLLPSFTGAPSYDAQGYSTNSSLTVNATAGNVSFNTLSNPGLISPDGRGAVVLPATLELTALSGGIAVEGPGWLYPSPTGELSLMGAQSITFERGGVQDVFGLLDEAPSAMPSPVDPQASFSIVGAAQASGSAATDAASHDSTLLHAGDLVPVRVYSLQGSIIDGTTAASGLAAGFLVDQLTLSVDKPAQIYAGQDIVDLTFVGQNLDSADLTRIVAGRDLYDTPLAPTKIGGNDVVPALLLAGPGVFDVEAGRNIGPLASETGAIAAGDLGPNQAGQLVTGIETVGDAYNPFLPHQSASLNLLFGIGPSLTSTFSLNVADFLKTYIAPGAEVPGVPGYAGELAAFVAQYDPGYSGDAWTAFQSLPADIQQLFVEQVFSNILYITGQDYNNVDSPYYHQYARGYQAINTLFPGSSGYTQNDLGGGTNGANSLATTGNLDVRGSTIQTQEGGGITILGPGGQALLGSNNAPPYVTGVNPSNQTVVLDPPNTQGILTLEGGDIDIFTDQSLQLAQSRIFTEQGGNMLIWSSNGDINAGNGVKTTAYVPPLQYLCDLNEYCFINPTGEVTGAGIATLQTVNGAPPGNVELVAPRGTVDAGNAGIRVSGNLTIAALHVANVFNIQVKGATVGVPTTAVDVGALSAANAAAAAAQQAADLAPRQQQTAASLITVEVVGFGEPDEEQKKKLRAKEDQGGL